MAYSTINTSLPPNKGGGKIVRVKRRPTLKDLLKLQVLIEDTTDFSPYYFNIIRKPEKLRLGGNIFEFAPPAGRFKQDTTILFEPVDVNNKPIAFEILKQTSQSIRICIFITDDVPEGPAQITIVGTVVIDDCGCPVPDEWKDKPNVRWSESVGTEKLSTSPVIIYDEDPYGTLDEIKIPWQYQTFEDVYNTNPGAPGTPYTVSGSYTSNYNSQKTPGSDLSSSITNNGIVNYFHDTSVPVTPNPPGGKATIQVMLGNFAFSSSMVGGTFFVGRGIEHIHGPNPYPNPLGRFSLPNYYATISAVLNSTTAEINPAYQIISNIAPEVPSYYPSTFHTKNGFQVTWNETSSSIAYTDPTAPSSSMTRVERTKEKAQSYMDTELFETKPDCGVATHVDVYVKSNRLEGELTKLTEFEITPWNFLIDDSKQLPSGNTEAFQPTGVFNSKGHIANKYWTSLATNGDTTTAIIDSSILMDGVQVVNEFSNKAVYAPILHNNTAYFIEFNAASKGTSTDTSPPKIEVYVSGDCVDPTNLAEPAKTALGYYVGCIENDGAGNLTTGTPFLNNSMEFITQHGGSCIVRFKVLSGEWYLSNIRLLNCTDRPALTGTTPNHIRALVPMPPITKFNDEYFFEFNYKNIVKTSERKTIFERMTFAGNDPNDFIDSQPGGDNIAIYNAINAVTTSKSFYVTGSTYISNSLYVTNNAHITGNVFVEGNVYSQEYHTNIVSSSILFDEGDTIFGNSIDDIHITTGSIFVTSSTTEYVTNNFFINRPEGDRNIFITNAHFTTSGDFSSSIGTITSFDGFIRNNFFVNNIESIDNTFVTIGPNLFVENNITASIISASQNITASSFTGSFVGDGSGLTNLNIGELAFTNITASNISASNTITANEFIVNTFSPTAINTTHITASVVSASNSIITNHLTASNFTIAEFSASRITASFINVGTATGSFLGDFTGQANLTGSLLGTASYGRDNDWYTQGSSGIGNGPTIIDKIYHNGKVAVGDYSTNDLFHQFTVDGTTKLGNNLSNEHNITGSLHMHHTNLSILSGSGNFGLGIANPDRSVNFSNTSTQRLQIFDGDTSAVGLQVINWETASAFTAGGGTPGGNELSARGPRAMISINGYNSKGGYGYGGTRGQAGGSLSFFPDTFEGNTNGNDIGDGGDTDSEGIRLLQEAFHISTGGNPQGSINIHARGDAGQQIRFFTGNDDARNSGGKDVETQRMTIKWSGEVGIGTHNPQRRFHVSKSINESASEPIVRFTTLPTGPTTVPVNMVIVDSLGDLYQTGTDVLLSQVNQAGVTNLTSSNIFTTAFTSSVISSSNNIIGNYFTASNSTITNITSTDINTTHFTASSATGSFVGEFTSNGTGFTGDLTGNVTGDLTGNVVGDLTGQVNGGLTGSVIGNVTGDLTGDVVGNLTGQVNGGLTGSLLGQVHGGLTGSMIGTASYASFALSASYGKDNDWYLQEKTYADGDDSDPTIDGDIYHIGKVGIGDFSGAGSPRLLHITQSLADYTAKTPPVRINSLHNSPQRNITTYNSSSGDLSYTELGCALDLVNKDSCCCNLSENTNIYIFIDRTSMTIVGSALATPAILTRWVITKFEKDMREKYPYWKGNIYVGEGTDDPGAATLTAERWLSWMSWPAVGNQNETSVGSGITGSMKSVRWTATGATDEDAGTYADSDNFTAFGYNTAAYYLENSPISKSGIPDTDVIVFALVDETDAGNGNQGGGYHYRQALIGSGSAPGTLENDWENHLTTHYKADYGLFKGKAYPSYDCFSGYVYALPNSTGMTLDVRQNFALHIYGAIEKDIVSPANFVSFSPTTANLNAITGSNPYANGVNTVGSNSPWYTGGIYGLASQSIQEKHDFPTGIAGWYGNIAVPTEANINKSGSWLHGQASMSADFFTFIDGNALGVKVDGTTICVNDANQLHVITGSLFANSKFTNIHSVTVTSSIVSSSNNIIANYFTSSNADITNISSTDINTTHFTASSATGSFFGEFTTTGTSVFTGNLTGNVTGDVAGNLTGDVTGDVAGDLTGNVVGNLTGQVNGGLTGSMIGTASYGRDNDWYLQGGSTIDSEPTLTGKIYHTGKVGVGDFSSADIFHQLAVEGSAKLGNNVSDQHDITGSIQMKHTNLSILSGSGNFGIGTANPARSVTFSNTSTQRLQIFDGDTSAVGFQVINWETASAFTAGGGTPGGNELSARGPRALVSINGYNSRASYGYGGTRGQAGGSLSFFPDTFEGNTNGNDIGDGGDTDCEGIRLLQEAFHISTGGNPQGSINIHARGDAGQQIRFFTGNDDARNSGGKDVETQRMTIRHNGAVGIGTHNPQRRLHVSKSLNEGLTTPIVRFEDLPTAPTTANTVMVDSNGDLYQSDRFAASSGTTTINDNLNVLGNITSSNNISASGTITGTSLTVSTTATISDVLTSGTVNTTHVTASGNISASGTTTTKDFITDSILVNSGDVVLDGGDVQLEDNQDIVWYNVGEDTKGRVRIRGNQANDDITLTVDNNNSHTIRLNTTGVGIGNLNPSDKLTVEGNISSSGALYLGNNVVISSSNNPDVDAGTEDIATIAHANYDAGFFDYVVKNGTNMRAGTVMAVHDGTNIELTDISTADLGNTERLQFSASLDATNLILQATVPSDNWIIKTLVRGI